MKKHLLLALMLTWLSACKTIDSKDHPTHQDGYEAGNGGNVVVCRDPQAAIESVELLDFYEGRELPTKLHPALGPSGWSQIEKARYALKRLARLDADRAAAYTKSVEKFFGAATFVKDQILPDTKDYGWVPVPENCRIEQIAVQKTPKGGGETSYTVNLDLWNLLNSDHQAGLVLHEVVYRDALGKGHKNSINTRHFNSLLASNRFTSMDAPSFRELLDRLALGDAPVTAHPPYWVLNPVPVGGCVNRPIESNLAAFAHDPNGRSLVFSLLEGPTWGRIEAGGMFRGTPDITALGENKFTARATNAQGLTADTVVRVGVTKCDMGAPKWMMDPIGLRVASEDQAYSFDVSALVTDPSGGRITFSAIGLPPWLRLDERGMLSGVPHLSDVGTFTGIKITATGIGGMSVVSANGDVLKVHHPAQWTGREIVLPDVKAGQIAQFDLTQYVINPEGGPLTFSVMSGPSFVRVTPTGILLASPGRADIGDHDFRAAFRTGEFGDTTTLRLRVTKDARPPVWLQNPLSLGDAKAGMAYAKSLAQFVYDPEGEALSFQKISGPASVRISSDGMLSGVPMKGDVGASFTVVRVFNPLGMGSDAPVAINVQ